MTQVNELKQLDEDLEIVKNQLNNLVSKTTETTLFGLLHGYKPKFNHGLLKKLSKASDHFISVDELEDAASVTYDSKTKDIREHNHEYCGIHFKPLEIVVMTRAPKHTGESK